MCDTGCSRYRSDVTRPADIAEEALRIHGFDHVPLPARMTGTLEVPSSPNEKTFCLVGENCWWLEVTLKSCPIH